MTQLLRLCNAHILALVAHSKCKYEPMEITLTDILVWNKTNTRNATMYIHHTCSRVSYSRNLCRSSTSMGLYGGT